MTGQYWGFACCDHTERISTPQNVVTRTRRVRGLKLAYGGSRLGCERPQPQKSGSTAAGCASDIHRPFAKAGKSAGVGNGTPPISQTARFSS